MENTGLHMEHNFSIANRQNSGTLLKSVMGNFKSIIGTSLSDIDHYRITDKLCIVRCCAQKRMHVHICTSAISMYILTICHTDIANGVLQVCLLQ